jgi:hypothetical protein
MMNWIDFFIGFTLMNAMPHYILGVWKARMLSGFGFGNKNNVAWGLVNFCISIALFVYQYGIENIFKNGIYLGGVSLYILFGLLAPLWYKLFAKK